MSSPVRFRTLGEKRNASALVSPDVDAYCVWDDDDIYLPWHMSAADAALASADYTIPSVVLIDKKDRLEHKANQSLFHGAWAFRREAFDGVSGYPFIQSGQDQGLLKQFKSGNLRRADPIQFEPRPSYDYRWFTAHSQHLSAMGKDGYERLSKLPLFAGSQILPNWDREWESVSVRTED